MQADMGSYAAYLGTKIGLAIVAAIIIGIATIILGVIIVVPSVALGLLAVLSGKAAGMTWNAQTIALAAQSMGFASGFSSATFRAVQLFALLLAPLWLAWGLVEAGWPSEAARFGTRLVCGALTVPATPPIPGKSPSDRPMQTPPNRKISRCHSRIMNSALPAAWLMIDMLLPIAFRTSMTVPQ